VATIFVNGIKRWISLTFLIDEYPFGRTLGNLFSGLVSFDDIGNMFPRFFHSCCNNIMPILHRYKENISERIFHTVLHSAGKIAWVFLLKCAFLSHFILFLTTF